MLAQPSHATHFPLPAVWLSQPQRHLDSSIAPPQQGRHLQIDIVQNYTL